MPQNTPINWKGEYNFRLSGSGLHEDTIRILSNNRKQERMLKLILPTLCITYADAKFQDSIGGEQKNYPASKAYGTAYFDPPVEILGEKEIEKFTYIRGAHRVEIGPKNIIVEFPAWEDLVIPRLRLSLKEPADALIDVPDTKIWADEPLKVTVMQYADGRHIGGVRMEKRHPEWKEPEVKENYNLWIRVIDGKSMEAMPEVMVDILHWDSRLKTPYGMGGFRLDDRKYTDGNGCIQIPNRPSGELEAYVVRRQGARAVVRCLRPLPGQNVRLHMRVWPMKREKSRRKPHPYIAVYYLEPWDTMDWVAKTFGYRNVKQLAKANKLKDPSELERRSMVLLPHWTFYYAEEKDTLESFDKKFGLPKGSSITVGKVYHPDPRLPYVGEVVAVPDLAFIKKRR